MDIYAEARKKIAKPEAKEKPGLRWFLGIILVGILVPGCAEIVADLPRWLSGAAVRGFGVAYYVYSGGEFGFYPAVSNVGPFFVYACLAPWILHAKFQSRRLARRLILGGLWGISLVIFGLTLVLVNDLHELGQGYFFLVVMFPMYIAAGIGALLGMAAGWLYDVVRR